MEFKPYFIQKETQLNHWYKIHMIRVIIVFWCWECSSFNTETHPWCNCYRVQCGRSRIRVQVGSNQRLWNWLSLLCWARGIKQKDQWHVGSESGWCVRVEWHIYMASGLLFQWSSIIKIQITVEYICLKCRTAKKVSFLYLKLCISVMLNSLSCPYLFLLIGPRHDIAEKLLTLRSRTITLINTGY